jgi:hypothetical protein
MVVTSAEWVPALDLCLHAAVTSTQLVPMHHCTFTQLVPTWCWYLHKLVPDTFRNHDYPFPGAIDLFISSTSCIQR